MDRAQSPASRGAGANQKGWADEQSPLLYRVSRVFFWVLFRLWVRCIKSEGGSGVPASGGIFLIANHTSALDPFIVSFPIPQRMTRGPGKIELYKNPIVGWYMHKVGIFPLRRDM
ncbi:MAG: 1-acyl-sn-glycerol-3-phosphate acyltransferase, partial [Chloroflexota bacterium]|nr:1-acyl-sn-glycerol-3-phosphate acyltransferase [Chloroflexota bacterium]